MSLRYDLYQPGRSALHRLDPRVKFLFAVCGVVALLSFRNLWIMLAALALTHALLLGSGVRWQRLGWVWKPTLPVMIMIAVLWVVFYPGEGPALLEWRFLRVTVGNIAEGLAMALRMGALAFVLFVWLFTTDQTALVRGLVGLGLPYEWGLTLGMALRYLPTMASAFVMISDAQQARGLDLAKRNPLQRARAYIPITVAMLITALRTAEGISYTLESRALGASRRRTTLHPLRYTTRDMWWTLVILAGTAMLLWARFAWGWGAGPL
jgi:energy-coupling factor transport system permease protein